MLWYSRAMAIVNWVVCLCAALFLVGVNFITRDQWEALGSPRLIAAFQESTFRPYWISGGTVLFALEVLVLTRFRSMRGSELLLKRDGGEIRLRVSALENLLSRVSKTHPSVIEARVRIRPMPMSRYRIACELTVLDSPDFHQVLDGVRQKLRRRFDELVPGTRDPVVDVDVREIIRDGQRQGAGEVAGPPYGPQYPLGGEEMPTPQPQVFVKRGK